MVRQNSTVHISVSDLVGEAIEVLEQYGLSDLSMRRVAARLEVQPSALYWHVRDKQSLLALVTDRLLDAVELDAPLPDWRAEVRARAVTLHTALLNTRDAAELVASVVALGIGGHRLRALIAEAVPNSPTPQSTMPQSRQAGPHDQTAADTLIDAVCSLMLGSALITQQRAQAAELGVSSTDPSPVSDLSAMLDLLVQPL